METLRVGRNERCPCGNGKKFKHCCLHRTANGNGAIRLPSYPSAPAPAPQPQFARPAGSSPGGGETIEATGGHPFWVISGEDLDKRPVPEHCPAEVPNAAIPGRWVNAIDLRIGDVLFTRDGRRVPVTNVSVRHVKMKVYNFQVEGLENYAVGHTGILVHNSSGPSGQPARPQIIQVDPAELHVPPSRPQGADPGKLARQISQHGNSLDGMPPLQLIRGKDGALRINDGVTRATRAAKLRPREKVPAEIIQDLPNLDVTRMPKIKDVLP